MAVSFSLYARLRGVADVAVTSSAFLGTQDTTAHSQPDRRPLGGSHHWATLAAWRWDADKKDLTRSA
jgi:hypothetical protein